MRFGGHETFPIRDGWLYKGLDLLVNNPEQLHDTYAADWLGVGKNMARAIRHWLAATGLAERDPESKGRTRTAALRLTDLGGAVWNKDRFFNQTGTYWILHVNLVLNDAYATTWGWFFNNFHHTRFEKPVALEALVRFLELNPGRAVSRSTLRRDLGCLLASYSEQIPPLRTDPEDALECPLADLGLLVHNRGSGVYVNQWQKKAVPAAIMGYCIARLLGTEGKGGGMRDVTLTELATSPGGPGRAFRMTSESLFETLHELSEQSPDFELVGLATERALRLANRPPADWIRDFYASPALKAAGATSD